MASLNLMNKVAIITGANSGLGQATAVLFAERGASVVLCGRDEARLKVSKDQCVKSSGGHAERFVTISGDLTNSENRKAIVKKAIDSFQRLDLLVANAGILLPEGDGISNISEENFDKMFDVNVKSVFFLIQEAVKHLKESGGNIVVLSSVVSTMAVARRPVYPMTKATIDSMIKGVALDLAPWGVRVNSVNPSAVPTRMRREFDENVDKAAKQVVDSESPKQPLYGECVTAEAIAECIAFLSSDAAKFITGQSHVVDGGRAFIGSTFPTK